jgi:ATP-dependent DNA ligase
VPAPGTSIAALRLGRRDGNQIVYVGKAGTGFTAKSAYEVRKRLEPLIRKTPPTAKPRRKRDTIWVEPILEAEIQFRDCSIRYHAIAILSAAIQNTAAHLFPSS